MLLLRFVSQTAISSHISDLQRARQHVPSGKSSAMLRQGSQQSTRAGAELPLAIARLLLKLQRDKVCLRRVAEWSHQFITQYIPNHPFAVCLLSSRTDNIPLQLLLWQISISDGFSAPEGSCQALQLQPPLPFQSTRHLFTSAWGNQRQGLLQREQKLTRKQRKQITTLR